MNLVLGRAGVTLGLAAAILGVMAAGYTATIVSDYRRMLEVADERVEMQVEARCWCGSRATHNARVVNGSVVYEGETVVVGDTNDDGAEPLFGDVVRYELLCRRHYLAGDMGD